MLHTETVHITTFFFEAFFEDIKKICDKALTFYKEDVVDINAFYGNAAAGPYIEVKSADKDTSIKVAKTILSYAKRFKSFDER